MLVDSRRNLFIDTITNILLIHLFHRTTFHCDSGIPEYCHNRLTNGAEAPPRKRAYEHDLTIENALGKPFDPRPFAG